jgi:DNA-binding response OmpR family regulator
MSQPPPVVLQVDRKLGETRPLRTELRKRGAKVLMTDSPEKAIELARQSPPDLLVLDDDTDPGSPVDLTEFFRSTYPEAEVILLSSRPEDTTRGIGMGLLFHGLRPVSSTTLLDLAQGALQGRLSEPGRKEKPSPLVMCVDDDPAALKSLARILGRHGYRVATFEDPQGVLGAIPRIGPDVAVIDVLMPGIDGRELSRQIREQYRGLFPIVMHSARSTDADRAAGFRYGADYFLPKPCDPHQLLDVVDYYADQLDPEERLFLESRI